MLKLIETTLKMNLTALNVNIACVYESIPSCMKLSSPPEKSKITLVMLSPTQLFLCVFKYTCGMYLTRVIIALEYPATTKKPKW